MTTPKKILIIAVVLIMAVVGIKLSQIPPEVMVKQDVETAAVEKPSTDKTPPRAQPPKKSVFDSDVQAREAYSLCKKHDQSLQDCVTTLGENYQSSGFEVLTKDGSAVVARYLTLPVKNNSFVSIRYDDGSVLLGNQWQLIGEAKNNKLSLGLNELLLQPSRGIQPVVKKM